MYILFASMRVDPYLGEFHIMCGSDILCVIHRAHLDVF